MAILKAVCTPETKAAFRALAAEHGLTEASLLRRLVLGVLQKAGKSSGPELFGGNGGKGGQIHLRLYAHEVRLIRELAEPSGQSAAGWVIALIRHQIEHAVPFSKEELAELREAILAIGLVGRNLNMITHRLLRSDRWRNAQGEFVRAAERAVEKVHRAVRNLAQRRRIEREQPMPDDRDEIDWLGPAEFIFQMPVWTRKHRKGPQAKPEHRRAGLAGTVLRVIRRRLEVMVKVTGSARSVEQIHFGYRNFAS